MTPEVLFLMKAERAAENWRQSNQSVDDKVRFQSLFSGFLSLIKKSGKENKKDASSKRSGSIPCPEVQGC